MQLQKNERRALCGICPAGCWVIVSYDEHGAIASARADESSPFGIVCKLGEHSPEIVYSENRLRYPLRRKGPKGAYEFERISWEEAFQEIVPGRRRQDEGREIGANRQVSGDRVRIRVVR